MVNVVRRLTTPRARQLAVALAFAVFGFATAMSQDTAAVGESAKTQARYSTWWLPDQSSTVAAPIDDLFYLILWITSVVFAIVFIALVWFMIRYRYSADRRAVYTHGNNKLEVAWTVIPALILVFLGIISQSLWSDMKQDMPRADTSIVIDVRPRQFQWDIRYAGADNKFNTPDDITTINQLHVPVNKAVVLNMEAQDVIHSFFVPEFRMKQDAVPGMVTRYWFTATKTGGYEIACAELCGLGHYRMRGFVTVHSPEDFDKWYRDEMTKKDAQLNPPPAPIDTSAATATDTNTSAAPGDTSAAATTVDTSAAGTDTAGN